MYEDPTFLEQILAAPQDNDLRRIYADFLEDQGDPRGELIRTQLDIDRLPFTSPERARLMLRERELLSTHQQQWFGTLRSLGVESYSVERGLLHGIRLRATDWLVNMQRIVEAAPTLNHVSLQNPQEERTALGRTEFPPQITSVDLSGNSLVAESIEALSAAPWLQQLAQFNLENNRLGDEGARLFVERLALPHLRTLRLGLNHIGEGIIGVPLASVTNLFLSQNPLGDAGISYVASQMADDGRRIELDVGCTRLTSAGMAALARSRIELLRLDLHGNAIDNRGWDLLARSPLAHRLRWLDARFNSTRMPDSLAAKFENATVLR